MLPGEVYYYAANSSVICVGRRPKRPLQASSHVIGAVNLLHTLRKCDCSVSCTFYAFVHPADGAGSSMFSDCPSSGACVRARADAFSNQPAVECRRQFVLCCVAVLITEKSEAYEFCGFYVSLYDYIADLSGLG